MYDCIVIGGGHNGLVTAAYLAKSGKSVCVLERRHILGGCASTEELWPGFKASPAAYVISLFLPQIIKDLKLKQHGLKIIPRIPSSSFTPDLNGPGLLLGPNSNANKLAISKYSAKDAQKFEEYESFLTGIVKILEPILTNILPHVLPVGRRLSIWPKLKELYKAFSIVRKMRSLGDKLTDVVELLSGAATPILNRWFDTEILKATLATDAIIGAFTSPSNPGSAYVLLHHVMGEVGGKRGIWGYVEGGMGGLADSLEKSCRELGVKIYKDIAVKEILIEDGKVYGVMTKNVVKAKTVASSVSPHLTFEKFIEEEHLPKEFLNRVRNIDYASASAKVNLALDTLPEFGGDKDSYTGTIHFTPTLDFIENAYHDAMIGRLSSEPVLEMTIPSVLDKTLTPPGKHVASIFVQYASNKIDWEQQGKKEAFYESCVKVLEKYDPKIREKILHHHILTPLDLERVYGLTGGNIFQGSMVPHQMGPFRPVAGWGYHTPIRGLYMCGASTHPGGGVSGINGRNAAKVILSGL